MAGVHYVGDPHGVLAACLDLIRAAEESLVLQMYLFAENGDQTLLLPREGAFPYAALVADRLIEKKRARPDLPMVVVLDSNTPADSALTRRKGRLVRERLEAAGIAVLVANLFGARFDPRRRLHPAMNLHLAPERVPASEWVRRQNAWQTWHNVEDHRKNLAIDGGRAAAITSHNFFDPAFDWHENLFWLTGEPARAVWRSAMESVRLALAIPQTVSDAGREAIDRLLGARERADSLEPTLAAVPGYPLGSPAGATGGEGSCRVLENDAIRPRIEALVGEAAPGDEVRLASAYFSDLAMLEALESAAARGVRVRVLVDSIHALPLPGVASWLTTSLVNHAVTSRLRTPVELRVHDSRAGRMMHLKTIARTGRSPLLVGGQANFTPNSFSGAWLETDVETSIPAVAHAFAAHFDQLWELPESMPPASIGSVKRASFDALLAGFGLVGLRP